MTLLILFAIWIVIGLLTGLTAGSLWKGNRPFGELGDPGLAMIVAVVVGLADWYLLPLLGIEGLILFLVAVVEPALGALLVLWLVRRLRRPTAD